MLRITKAVLIATAVTISLSGCVIERPHPRRPPPPVEVVPVMPAPGAQWVGGHYRWGGNQWLWVPGHWRRL